MDDNLSFKAHIDKLVTKLKLKLGFFYRNASCFSLQVRSHLVKSTFLPLLDYGDLHAPVQYLKRLDSMYNSALRFVTKSGLQVHHCTLYATAKCPSLASRRLTRWLTFVHKSLIGLAPSYLSELLIIKQSHYALRSQDSLQLVEPKTRIDLGEMAFSYAAPKAWNQFQEELKLPGLVRLHVVNLKLFFKTLRMALLENANVSEVLRLNLV